MDYQLHRRTGLLLPLAEWEKLEQHALAVKRRQFQHYLEDESMFDITSSFLESSAYEYLRNYHGTKMDQQDTSQPVSTSSGLKNARDLPAPESIEELKKVVGQILSDEDENTRYDEAWVRVFNAESVMASISSTSASVEKLEQVWRLIAAVSSNNGYRKLFVDGEQVIEALKQVEADFPNFAEVTEHVAMQLKLMQFRPHSQRRLKPILLNGSPGCGKSTYAKALARALKCRFSFINLAGATTCAELSGLSQTWATAQPGKILTTLASHNSACPLILLDEIDKARGDDRFPIQSGLLAALEPATSQTLQDEFGGFEFDASRISYLATSNSTYSISEPLLSRFEVFDIKQPDRAQRATILRNMVKESYVNIDFSDQAAAMLADKARDLRQLRKLVDQAVATHVNALLSTMGGGQAVALADEQVVGELSVAVALR